MSFFEKGTLKSNEKCCFIGYRAKNNTLQDIFGASGKSGALGLKSGVRVSKLSGSNVGFALAWLMSDSNFQK